MAAEWFRDYIDWEALSVVITTVLTVGLGVLAFLSWRTSHDIHRLTVAETERARARVGIVNADLILEEVFEIDVVNIGRDSAVVTEATWQSPGAKYAIGGFLRTDKGMADLDSLDSLPVTVEGRDRARLYVRVPGLSSLREKALASENRTLRGRLALATSDGARCYADFSFDLDSRGEVIGLTQAAGPFS